MSSSPTKRKAAAAASSSVEDRLSALEAALLAKDDEVDLLREQVRTTVRMFTDELVELQDKVVKLEARAGMGDDEAEEDGSDESEGSSSEPRHASDESDDEDDKSLWAKPHMDIKARLERAAAIGAAAAESNDEEQKSAPSTPVKAAAASKPVCPDAPRKRRRAA